MCDHVKSIIIRNHVKRSFSIMNWVQSSSKSAQLGMTTEILMRMLLNGPARTSLKVIRML